MVTDNKRDTQNTNQNFQKKMKTVRIKNKHNMQSVKLYEAESIEEKVRRIVDENEPIEDGAPIIFQERIDGVKPEYNIRTDRWEVAIEAMDKVSADELSRYTKSQEKPGEGIERPKPKEGEQANVELKTDGTATAPNDN